MNQDRSVAETGSSLNHLLATAGLQPLDVTTAAKFDEYLALILRWNSRMNLTAIRAPEEILSRHFVESIACARLLPEGIGSLLDFGSGAGFPGIPIALCSAGDRGHVGRVAKQEGRIPSGGGPGSSVEFERLCQARRAVGSAIRLRDPSCS